jgi:hypothetical protein
LVSVQTSAGCFGFIGCSWEDFDFEAFTRTAFPVHGGEPQHVRIRFSSDQAPHIMERHWHDSQTFFRKRTVA